MGPGRSVSAVPEPSPAPPLSRHPAGARGVLGLEALGPEALGPTALPGGAGSIVPRAEVGPGEAVNLMMRPESQAFR